MTHLLWIIPGILLITLIVGVVINAKKGEGKNTKTEKKYSHEEKDLHGGHGDEHNNHGSEESLVAKIAGWIVSIIGIVLVIWLVLTLKSCAVESAQAIGKGLERGRGSDPDLSVPRHQATTSPWAPCQNEWSFRDVEVPAHGVPEYLCQGWKGFPTGKVSYTSESGEIWKDAPDIISHFGYMPSGVYMIKSDPEGSKLIVRIYNRW